MQELKDMSKSELFNVAFNSLHEELRNRFAQPKMSFGELLNLAEKNKDKVVLGLKKDLDHYREIRNLLTHGPNEKRPQYILPSQSLIDDVVKTTEKIKNPKKVYQLFNNQVMYFDLYDSLTDVLAAVREKEYSQFPVFDKGVLVGLITENGITRYLARSAEEDIISINDIIVKDILKSDDGNSSISIVGTNSLIHDVEDTINKKVQSGNSIFVVLVSSKGKKISCPSDIKGIITPWDLPRILENK